MVSSQCCVLRAALQLWGLSFHNLLPNLSTQHFFISPDLAWIQEIEHRVSGSPGHKKDTVQNHREEPERPMASGAVRPDPLNRHFN